MTDTRI